MKFMSMLPWILVVLGFVIGISVGVYITSKPTLPPSKNPDDGVACTQEAKICPGGTSVGRTGPKCEFTACPTY